MKTAATGDIQLIDRAEGGDNARGKIRIPLTLRADRAKNSVRVVLDVDDYGLLYLIDNLKSIAKRRAAAHEMIAASLREEAP